MRLAGQTAKVTHRTKRRSDGPGRRLAAAAVIALLPVSACSARTPAPSSQQPGVTKALPAMRTPASELRPFYEQRPDWSDCGDGFQCARIQVPLDYTKPSGERIELSAIRLPASGTRAGSLLINPGGPGGSGIQYARAAKSVVSERVREQYDVVGFDPRGVGESTPVHCMTGAQLDKYVGMDSSPDSPAEVTELDNASKQFAERCGAQSAHLLPHVGTADAARDMDVLRGVLGDAGLTYLGKSYGTYLGAMYAELFPKNVRALVLDGAVDPAMSAVKSNEVQAKGFEVALRAFAEDCFLDGACPFTSRTVDGAMKEISDLLARADRQPLKNDLGDGRVVNEAWTVLGIATPLYERTAWPQLRQALGQAMTHGNGTSLLRMADLLVDRRSDGTYSNQTEANMAVNCVDHRYPTSLDAYGKAADAAGKMAPHFGPFVMWGSLPCAYWPAKSAEADKPIKGAGAPPILVVGTLRDPATPYEWAQGLAKELTSGVLLGYDGDGHTAYRSGSTCVDTAVDDYLLTLRAPKNGTVCPKAT
ncbi:alpha/beta hydrolase [Microbispora triticiradicis]|uniref:alpha/beta hydrolase n=1 Tax=Microbispora triticiradicis TaxID=2200763 RepID=UPI001AD653DE|nr:alpha/beta hydrolase [Microbispora triticiradicis]MBO4270838.1 alpha/beta fold hydrolase [Microbispora triticiradicis]